MWGVGAKPQGSRGVRADDGELGAPLGPGGFQKQGGRRRAGHAQKEPHGGSKDGVSPGNPCRGHRRPDKMFQGFKGSVRGLKERRQRACGSLEVASVGEIR